MFSPQYTVPRSYTFARTHRETSDTIKHIIFTPSYVDDRGVQILPLLPSAKTSGREDRHLQASIKRPTFNGFLAAYRERMYSNGILAPSYLPLAYCWASNLLFALSEVQDRKKSTWNLRLQTAPEFVKT